MFCESKGEDMVTVEWDLNGAFTFCFDSKVITTVSNNVLFPTTVSVLLQSIVGNFLSEPAIITEREIIISGLDGTTAIALINLLKHLDVDLTFPTQ